MSDNDEKHDLDVNDPHRALDINLDVDDNFYAPAKSTKAKVIEEPAKLEEKPHRKKKEAEVSEETRKKEKKKHKRRKDEPEVNLLQSEEPKKERKSKKKSKDGEEKPKKHKKSSKKSEYEEAFGQVM